MKIPIVLNLTAAADIERINNKKKKFCHLMAGLERTPETPGILKRRTIYFRLECRYFPCVLHTGGLHNYLSRYKRFSSKLLILQVSQRTELRSILLALC